MFIVRMGIVLAAFLLFTDPAASQEAALGGTLEELRQAARNLNPEAAQKALEAEAQLQAVGAAGAWPDPSFEISFEDIDRDPTRGPQPVQLGSIYYNIDQTIPLWGKRGLERNIAQAQANLAGIERDQALLVLDERIKAAFAAYCLAAEMETLTNDLQQTLDHISQVTTERYALAAATQADAAQAGAERSQLDQDRILIERDLNIAQSQLNALLARPAGAALERPGKWRPLPEAGKMTLDDLLARAQSDAPEFKHHAATIDAAKDEADLAERAWYPDLNLGVSVVDENRDLRGYEARVGFDIPLDWDARNAAETSAKTRLAAAKQGLEAARLALRGQIEETFWSYQAAGNRLHLIDTSLLPQAQLALDGTLAAYEVGQATIDQVLASRRQVQQMQVSRLQLQYEQQVQLARIETLIGGDL